MTTGWIRALRFSFILFFLGFGCSDVRSSHAKNPFVYERGENIVLPTTSVLGCFRVMLRAGDVPQGSMPALELNLENSCSLAVAILTAPLEIRFVLEAEDRLRYEGMLGAVYNTLIIYRIPPGLSSKTFLADGALPVRMPPQYRVISPGSSVTVGFIGEDQALRGLSPGSYGASLTVLAAPVELSASTEGDFDFGNTVARHNGTTSSTLPPLSLSQTVSRIGAAATFIVKQ